MNYKDGQRVKVNSPGSMFHGQRGTVVRAYTSDTGEWVRVDFGNPREHAVPMRPDELVCLPPAGRAPQQAK